MRVRIRDSKTGKYISAEEANSLTPERYVVERDKADETDALLSKIFDELSSEGVVLANVCYVNMESVRAVFIRNGLL